VPQNPRKFQVGAIAIADRPYESLQLRVRSDVNRFEGKFINVEPLYHEQTTRYGRQPLSPLKALIEM